MSNRKISELVSCNDCPFRVGENYCGIYNEYLSVTNIGYTVKLDHCSKHRTPVEPDIEDAYLDDIRERFCAIVEFIGDKHTEVAVKLRTHTSTLSFILNRKRYPTVTMLNYMADEYSVNLNWIITGTGKSFIDDKN